MLSKHTSPIRARHAPPAGSAGRNFAMMRCAIAYFKAQVLQQPPPPGGNALLQNIKTLFVELGRICLLVTGLDSNGQVLMVLV